jgi:hypothetical protein
MEVIDLILGGRKFHIVWAATRKPLALKAKNVKRNKVTIVVAITAGETLWNSGVD